MMKATILKISLILLLAYLVWAGCEKNNEINYDSTGIAGKWQLIQFPKTCVGFRNQIIEITLDSVFKSNVNGRLDFASSFNIKSGNMGYDTIFFHEPDAESDYKEIKLFGRDTLHLVSPILTALPTCNYFKRLK